MKTQDNARCLRPDCRFQPLPTLNDRGELEISPYCSMADRLFCIAAYYTANAEQTPETQREMHRLSIINDILDLREHPSQYDDGLATVEDLKAVWRAGS